MKKEKLRSKCTEYMRIVKRKVKKVFQVISNHASEYCTNSTIHGLVYLGAKDKSLVEKVWWLTMFLLSLMTGAYFIVQIWKLWVDHPVIVCYASSQVSIWDVPFPAVTICPQGRIKQSKYDIGQVAAMYKDLPVNESELLWDVAQICDRTFWDKYAELIKTTTNKRIYDNILKVTPQLLDTIKHVRWKNKEWTQVAQLFSPLFTEFGLCFTFNSLGLGDMYKAINVNDRAVGHNRTVDGWSIENGYPKNAPMDTYPERISQEGVAAGLQVLLEINATDSNVDCGFTASGFKIMLHNPVENPRIKQQFKLVSVNTHAMLSVTPTKVSTSRGLLNIPLRARLCFFPHERQLKYFSEYTLSNCRDECLVNTTIKECKCTPFHLPREVDVEICGINKQNCIKQAENNCANSEIADVQFIEYILTGVMRARCLCLPTCASLDYSADISYSDIQNVDPLLGMDYNNKQSRADSVERTRVDIFFSERQYTGMHRSERYTEINFIAQCGSLLGLCMGFSFLSLIEIIYFLTLRVFCKLRQRKESANK